jgi:hypothetical protein
VEKGVFPSSMLTTDDIGGLRVGDGFLQRSANCNILTKNITYPIQKINKLFVRLIICVSSINFLSFRPSIINNEFPIGKDLIVYDYSKKLVSLKVP